MNFSKLLAVVFGVIFIIVLYFIIYYALKIMYKDTKGTVKIRPQGEATNNIRSTKNKGTNFRTHGLEVMKAEDDIDLEVGSVIPVKGTVTLGRKEENSIVLKDLHVSGNHARLLIINNLLYIEDLSSTNGTFVNENRISGKAKLFSKDMVRIGTTIFKVLG